MVRGMRALVQLSQMPGTDLRRPRMTVSARLMLLLG